MSVEVDIINAYLSTGSTSHGVVDVNGGLFTCNRVISVGKGSGIYNVFNNGQILQTQVGGDDRIELPFNSAAYTDVCPEARLNIYDGGLVVTDKLGIYSDYGSIDISEGTLKFISFVDTSERELFDYYYELGQITVGENSGGDPNKCALTAKIEQENPRTLLLPALIE